MSRDSPVARVKYANLRGYKKVELSASVGSLFNDYFDSKYKTTSRCWH